MDQRTKPQVASSVKDESLVETRRQQIIQAGVKLFKEKGFHRTTTREIAKAAGFSIGTLYEYIGTKEDVLYLVCDSIFEAVVKKVTSFPMQKGNLEELKYAIREYYFLIDEMSDEFTIMYQETKSLQKESMQYVLQKELEMVSIFEKIIESCAMQYQWKLSRHEIHFVAHAIVVQGQSWAFRKWTFKRQYTIEQFIEMQMKLIFQGLYHF